MTAFWKKKYRYHLPTNSDFVNYSKNTTNVDIDIDNSPYFLFSPISLAESIHVGQLYQLFLQDTFRRFLGKKTKNTYKDIFLWDFSLTIYKNLWHQTIHTEKINKQQKQNKNKIIQSFIPYNNEEYNSLDEHTFLKTRELFVDIQNHISIQQKNIPRDTQLSRELNSKDYYIQEQKVPQYEIKFFVDGKGDAIPTYWDCPYTFFSTVAIAVNPKDRRYKKHLGRNVIIPIINKKIPIITDENISMIEGQWAKAINPGHDNYGLTLALKYHLSTDQYSISNTGNFTKICGRFAWKNVNEFKDNIIKYLSDIWNLSKIWSVPKPIYYNRYTNTPLITLNKKQYFFSNSTIEADITPISSYAKVWWLLPILNNKEGESYIFSEKDFLAKEKSSPSLVLFLMIIHLLLEWRMRSSFRLEDYITLLFSPSASDQGKKKKYEKYLEYYYHYPSIQKKDVLVIKNILNTLITDLHTDTLSDLLNKIPYLTIQKDWNYHVLWNKVINQEEEYFLQTTHYFHKDFLMTSLYHSILSRTTSSIICFDNSQKSQVSLLKYISQNSHYSPIFFDTLCDEKWVPYTFKNSKILYSQLQTIQKQYGPDSIRILFLKAQQNKENITSPVPYIERMIQKIWNMCRLSFHTIPKTQIHWFDKDLSQKLNKNISKFTPFDLWIIKQTNELIYRINEHRKTDKYLEWLELLERYIIEYFDHYVEIQKIYSSQYSSDIMSYCLIFLLQYLEDYLPLLCYSIRQYFDYSTLVLDPIIIEVPEYKANIFNDLITKIQELKLQNGYMKHELIDVNIQCGPDMHNFLVEYKPVFMGMLPIRELEIWEQKEICSDDYLWEHIIDIRLGIKKVENKQTKKETIEEISKHIAEIEDEIQRKKILLGRILPLGDMQKIKEKKVEIEQLKEYLSTLKTKLNP